MGVTCRGRTKAAPYINLIKHLYTGEPLFNVGMAEVMVVYKSQTAKLPFDGVEFKGTNYIRPELVTCYLDRLGRLEESSKTYTTIDTHKGQQVCLEPCLEYVSAPLSRHPLPECHQNTPQCGLHPVVHIP